MDLPFGKARPVFYVNQLELQSCNCKSVTKRSTILNSGGKWGQVLHVKSRKSKELTKWLPQFKVNRSGRINVSLVIAFYALIGDTNQKGLRKDPYYK